MPGRMATPFLAACEASWSADRPSGSLHHLSLIHIYTDFANINTGGVTPEGHDGVNEVSYLILECMDEMKLLQPSSNVQISKKTPQEFLIKACEISRKGWGQPAFYNTESIIQELLNAGKSIADARKGGTSGCVETGAFGNEAYILTCLLYTSR